jgi:hypothetical protein
VIGQTPAALSSPGSAAADFATWYAGVLDAEFATDLAARGKTAPLG